MVLWKRPECLHHLQQTWRQTVTTQHAGLRALYFMPSVIAYQRFELTWAGFPSQLNIAHIYTTTNIMAVNVINNSISPGNLHSVLVRGPHYPLWCFDIAERLANAVHPMKYGHCTMTSSNGTIFRVNGPLWGEFTIHRLIPQTKASDAEMFSLIRAWTNGWVNNRDAGDLRPHGSHHDVNVIISIYYRLSHMYVYMYVCLYTHAYIRMHRYVHMHTYTCSVSWEIFVWFINFIHVFILSHFLLRFMKISLFLWCLL